MTEASYDFYSPFFQATIITQTGQRVPLWMNNEQGIPTAARAFGGVNIPVLDRPYLQEVSVKLMLGGVAQITARLTPTYEQGIQYLNSTLSEWGQSELEILLGYSTGGSGIVMGPPYTGLLLKPDIQIGPEISITLNAQGGSFNLSTIGSAETLRGNRFEIVTQLLRGPDRAHSTNLQLSFDDDVYANSEAYAAWFGVQLSIPMGGRTNWQWISQLVWEARCWLYIDGNAIRIFTRTAAATRQPRYLLSTFNFPGGVGPQAGVFPILTASSPTMGAYLPGVLRGLATPRTDPRTRQTANTVHTDATVRPARTGDGTTGAAPTAAAPGPGPNQQQLPQGLDVRPQEEAETLRNRQVDQARAEFELGQTNVGIKLEVETLGIPDLIPGEVLSVRGLGIRVDTPNYAVMTVTHTASGTGFTSRMELIANVETIASGAGGQLPRGDINRFSAPNPPLVDAAGRRELISMGLLREPAANQPPPSGRRRNRRSPTRRSRVAAELREFDATARAQAAAQRPPIVGGNLTQDDLRELGLL